MKQETDPFPKTKIQWLWENMKGHRGIYFVGMAGTVVYNILQLTVPYFSGKIIDAKTISGVLGYLNMEK